MQCVEPRIAVTAAQPAVTRSDLPPVLDCVTVVGPVQPAADRVKEPAQPVAGQAVTIRDETPVSGTRCATHTYGIPMVEVIKTDDHVSLLHDMRSTVTPGADAPGTSPSSRDMSGYQGNCVADGPTLGVWFAAWDSQSGTGTDGRDGHNPWVHRADLWP